MILFVLATISPAVLILAAAGFGGVWAWLAVGWLTLLAFSLDRLVPEEIENADPQAEFPAGNGLLVTLALAHLALLPCAIWATGGASGLGLTDRILVALATTLFLGQISHPVAHELIHRPARGLRLLGQTLYTTMLFGHHASAHLRVHHTHVGSDKDPNSARLGEGFYRFALRAWPGGFRAGLRAENQLRRGRAPWRHPYTFCVAGGLAASLGAYLLAGPSGLIAFLLIAVYAQLQILMSDYVQHYGLRRHEMADGRLEPVGPQHSWNAPHWFTASMTLNAPRHSDHHVAPGRPYPALQLDEDKMPCLPYSLPVMAGLALIPPLWRHIMDPRCARWQPVWIDRPDTSARDIPPAVLAHAKSGGTPLRVLPNSAHADPSSDPLPADDRHHGHGRPADERG